VSKVPRCRICDAAPEHQSVRAPNVYGGGDQYKFWECYECTAVYLYPQLTPEEEKRFYAQEFEGFMATRAGDERDWTNTEAHKHTNQDQVRRRWPFFEEFVGSGKTVLEIGCSSGFMLDSLRDAGMECIGVEPSGEFLPYLHSQGYDAHESLSELDSSSQFDLILHFFVFEHIADPYEFLRQTWNLLKPGGAMVAEIPCVNDPLTSVYHIPDFEGFYWSIAHHYYYSPKALTFVLNRLNLPYTLVPEQRYDLSNHMHWMMEGKPGGQGRFNELFGESVIREYREALMRNWSCDTIFLIIRKPE